MPPPVSQYFLQRWHTTPLPRLIDELAELCPDRPMVSLPWDNDHPVKGYRDYSIAEFAAAVNRAAWWIELQLGRAPTPFTTLHYVAPQDLSYFILTLAAVKTGYKTLTCHPSADVDTHLSLMEHTDCHLLLYPPCPNTAAIRKVNSIRALKSGLTALVTPTLDDWLSSTSPPVYPFPHDLASILHDPFTVIHSSASTGPAKPILFTHATVCLQPLGFGKIRDPSHVNYERWRGQRVGVLTPLSIAAGLFPFLAMNFCFDLTLVLPATSGPMSATLMDHLLVHGNVSACILGPKTLPDTCANPTYLSNLRRVRYLAIVGAPCQPYLAPLITAHAQITHIYGSSESGTLPAEVLPDPDDWAYLKLSPEVPHEYRPVCQSYHELVLLRRPHGAAQPVFAMFRDQDEYPMGDLFAPHPTRPDCWRYCGRRNDLIGSEQGLFLPRDMEWVLEAHPAVRWALICEERRGGLALLLDLIPDALEKGHAHDENIWDTLLPLIERANALCPIPAAIRRELVLFTDSVRPLPLSVKGNPQRVRSRELYRADIERVFGCADREGGVGMPLPSPSP
ncbi:acetyl-CoA synthetase-like protein [Aspergillus heteromorphus CBS 117.55]|uniref:Acetyl-CoA synthetase-like protein n=1 Tax=Aspergillus heteromorphus CBS 117.55 TaxID=1448321 RepID=A0A317WFR2_9EURO|nr:acetyl-CoA synthetase-like protein [Aspergillus heteromorphus CBS 117.55]PWY84795.1 acetyl-CoA synthetase-like protein [Aspergillus heteromorphus CBS 117.55]